MLSPAFKYNAGLIRGDRLPISVSGSTGVLTDRQGNPISSDNVKRVDAIHRTDWQGRQLLYPTARTNVMTYGSDQSTWAYNSTYSSKTYVPSVVEGGTAARWTHIVGQTSSNISQQAGNSHPITGSTETAYIILEDVPGVTPPAKSIVGMRDTTVDGYIVGVYFNWTNENVSRYSSQGDPNATFEVTKLSTSGPNGGRVFQITMHAAGTAGHAKRLYAYLWGATDPGNGFDIIIHAAHWEEAATAGTLIPQFDANAVTVTDYTLSGSAVSFGEAPTDDAIYDWAGVAQR